MQGSVRKRGSMWSYSFDMGTVGGKRQRKEKGGFRTKKEAEAALAKAISEYNNAGFVFEPSSSTLSDYLDMWLEDYVKKYSLQYLPLYTVLSSVNSLNFEVFQSSKLCQKPPGWTARKYQRNPAGTFRLLVGR